MLFPHRLRSRGREKEESRGRFPASSEAGPAREKDRQTLERYGCGIRAPCPKCLTADVVSGCGCQVAVGSLSHCRAGGIGWGRIACTPQQKWVRPELNRPGGGMAGPNWWYLPDGSNPVGGEPWSMFLHRHEHPDVRPDPRVLERLLDLRSLAVPVGRTELYMAPWASRTTRPRRIPQLRRPEVPSCPSSGSRTSSHQPP